MERTAPRRQDDDTTAWLDLLARGINPRWVTEWLRTHHGPQEILGASDAQLAAAAPGAAHQLRRLRVPPAAGLVAKQSEAMGRHGIRLVPMNAPEFPRNLFRMQVPPPAVFVKGTLEDSDALAVALVGPRDATNYGISVAKALARDFSRHLTVISGAALGVDSAAHQGALDAGGRTLAVIGCGIDVNYPARNEGLRQRIAADNNGAIISQFPPGTQPLRGNFPQRNVVLAGLSLACVVVEAGPRSGALVTARVAGEEGRPVYAVPGDITRTNSQGSNALLRDGAIACTGARDVISDLEGMLTGELEALRARRSPPPSATEPDDRTEGAGGTGAAAMEVRLLRAIGKEPTHHDDLIHQFVPHTMSLGELSTALLMMELDGRVEQLPGRLYQVRL